VRWVRQGRFHFHEVTYSHWSFSSQAVRFDKYAGLLEPREEVVVITFKLNIAETSVAKHVAFNTYLRLVLFIDPRGQHF